ncbi:uncharacterized protein LOC105661896 isoform X4 [Megachile rotundata]|uniref:uncharacterized protein LOC105661896 isoform X4 n=1 Tax=Megachile rotundata TaxID=143995 RepID=UPI003FD4628B
MPPDNRADTSAMQPRFTNQGHDYLFTPDAQKSQSTDGRLQTSWVNGLPSSGKRTIFTRNTGVSQTFTCFT